MTGIRSSRRIAHDASRTTHRAYPPPTHAAAVRFELRLPEVQSLKEKRSVLRPVLRRLRDRELSVAEVGHQDDWQRATIGVAVVAPQRGRLDHLVDGLQRMMLDDPTVEVIDMAVSYLEGP
jgi:uncharacterized protein YlxP (DUF503 family)